MDEVVPAPLRPDCWQGRPIVSLMASVIDRLFLRGADRPMRWNGHPLVDQVHVGLMAMVRYQGRPGLFPLMEAASPLLASASACLPGHGRFVDPARVMLNREPQDGGPLLELTSLQPSGATAKQTTWGPATRPLLSGPLELRGGLANDDATTDPPNEGWLRWLMQPRPLLSWDDGLIQAFEACRGHQGPPSQPRAVRFVVERDEPLRAALPGWSTAQSMGGHWFTQAQRLGLKRPVCVVGPGCARPWPGFHR